MILSIRKEAGVSQGVKMKLISSGIDWNVRSQ